MSETEEKGTKAPLSFGDASFCLKDQPSMPSRYDRLAYGNRGQILLIGVVDYANKIRAMRAMLNSAAQKLTIECTGVRATQLTNEYGYYGGRNPGRLSAGQSGYRIYVNKLEYGLCHALFASKEPGFMTTITPEALWEELNDTRFTTPILREWMPYLEKKLRKKSLLEEAWCFRCNAGFITASSEHLDTIVSEGLQTGEIAIPELPSVLPLAIPMQLSFSA